MCAYLISLAYSCCPKENSIDLFTVFSKLPTEETALIIVLSWAKKGNIDKTPKNEKIRHTIKWIKSFPKDRDRNLIWSPNIGHIQCMSNAGDILGVIAKYGRKLKYI